MMERKGIKALWFYQMMRRESLKLQVELARDKTRRQHIPVDCVLADYRWKRKSDARISQKRQKLQPRRSR